jgi:hypothetical protein
MRMVFAIRSSADAYQHIIEPEIQHHDADVY